MEDLRTRIRNLRQEIFRLREDKKASGDVWEQAKAGLNFPTVDRLRARKTLTNKDDGILRTLDFGRGTQLMTLAAGALAAGSIVVWDIDTEQRQHLIELDSTWIMTATIDSSEGRLVGAGGLENVHAIYRLRENQDVIPGEQPEAQLLGHHAVINDSEFVDSGHVITAAGDTYMKLWDIHGEVAENSFEGHTSDVFCCTCSPDAHIYLSGAGDFTARLWDSRRGAQGRGGIVNTFDTKSRDVQSVAFFPDGKAFAAGLSNTQVHLYDIRASCKLATFTCDDVRNQFTVEKVAFSSSGRLLFARYAQGRCWVYDVTGTARGPNDIGPVNSAIVGQLHTNNDKVLDVAVHSEGNCVAVGEEKGPHTVAKVFWPMQTRRNN